LLLRFEGEIDSNGTTATLYQKSLEMSVPVLEAPEGKAWALSGVTMRAENTTANRVTVVAFAPRRVCLFLGEANWSDDKNLIWECVGLERTASSMLLATLLDTGYIYYGCLVDGTISVGIEYVWVSGSTSTFKFWLTLELVLIDVNSELVARVESGQAVSGLNISLL